MKWFFCKGDVKKKKVLEFMDTKGFYIVLFLCILVITLTAYVVTKRNLSAYMNNTAFEKLSKQSDIQDKGLSINDMPKIDIANNSIEEKKMKNEPITIINEPVKPSEKSEVKETTQLVFKPKQKPNMNYPVIGKITKDFAKNSLVYSKTLEQWTTHEGIDISSERGTPVKAAFDGIISNVYNDYRYGITVEIDHGYGIKTKYSNLSTDSMVKKGMKVKKGDVISGVGNTALFESNEDSHLHFEVIEEKENVDPKEYIE